jgi:hypothetical protein
VVISILIKSASKKSVRFWPFYFGPLLSVLSLLKPVAILFSLLVIVMIFFSFIRRPFRKVSSKSELKELCKGIFNFNFLVLLLFAVIPYFLWLAYLRFQRIPRMRLFGDFTSESGTKRLGTTLSTFMTQFFDSNSLPFFLNWFWIIFLLLLLTFLAIRFLYKGKYESTVLIIFVSGFVFYSIFIFLLYFYGADEYERINGQSIPRYFASYILPWVFILFLLIVNSFHAKYFTRIMVPILILSNIVVFSFSPLGFEIRKLNQNADLLQDRQYVQALAQEVSQTGIPNQKVYMIEQGSTGLKNYMFVYDLMPTPVNWGCWSIGPPLYQGDIWTCDLKLSEVLRNFDRLVVFESDFFLPSEGLLESGEKTIPPGVYSVKEDSRGVPILTLISN